MSLDKNKTGLVLGIILGAWHFAWALLVATGFAKTLLDFVYSIHFLSNPFVIQPFNLTTAVALIIVTFMVGYVMGWFFAFVWNKLHKK